MLLMRDLIHLEVGSNVISLTRCAKEGGQRREHIPLVNGNRSKRNYHPFSNNAFGRYHASQTINILHI